MCGQLPLAQTDLEPTRFTCNNTNKIEASVASDNTIDGTGSTANPLTITPSTDANNNLTLGTDGKLFVGGGIAVTQICMIGTDTIPIGLTPGCFFMLENHLTYADGIYIWGPNAPMPVVTW